MKLKSFISLIFFISVFSCEWRGLPEMNQDACGVKDPLHDLPWLSDLIASQEALRATDAYPYFYITQAELNGEAVFVMNNCCPFCNTVIPVYNCNGEVVLYLKNGDDVHHAKIIWEPDGFLCSI